MLTKKKKYERVWRFEYAERISKMAGKTNATFQRTFCYKVSYFVYIT